MAPHPTPWTMETVTAGLARFYREIVKVGLVFPRADRPIAVEVLEIGLESRGSAAFNARS